MAPRGFEPLRLFTGYGFWRFFRAKLESKHDSCNKVIPDSFFDYPSCHHLNVQLQEEQVLLAIQLFYTSHIDDLVLESDEVSMILFLNIQTNL